MSDTTPSRSWWKDFVLVLLGAALAILGSVIAGWMSQASDRESFLREQRLGEYSAFLTAMIELERTFDELVVANTAPSWDNLPSPTNEQRALSADALADLQTAYSRVQVIGSSEAVTAAAEAVDYHVSYAAFLASRLAEIEEDSGSIVDSQTDWFYEGGAEFMSASIDCLRPLAREPFISVVQTDLDVEHLASAVPEVCATIDWDDLHGEFVDALIAGSFASPADSVNQ